MTKLFNCISVSFLFLCFCTFNSVAYADAPVYKLVDLGLQESDQSEAVAVNDNGQVAGVYWMFGKKYYFMWTENEGITLIDLPETANITVLNNQGQLAGNYKDFDGKDRGFIWDPLSGFSDIGTLGGSFTRVYDMNDLGQIVGESESDIISLVDGHPEQHAFKWQYGSMIYLGALTGDLGIPGDRSKATGINNNGEIIGSSNSLIAHKRKFLRKNDRAVFWQEYAIDSVGGVLLDFVIEEVDPSHKGRSAGLSINDNGFVIYHKYNSFEYGHYLINLKTKHKIQIKQFVGDGYFAKINNNDNILYFPADIQDVLLASLRQANEILFKTQDCDNLTSYSSQCLWSLFLTISTPEWKQEGFGGAYDFNNNNWVVGTALNTFGEKHAVLLTPVNETIKEESKNPIESGDKEKELEESKDPEDKEEDFEDSTELDSILIKYVNNSEHLTPFHYAVKIGDKHAVEVMIIHGVDVNLMDAGSTPLHRAIESNNLGMVSLLLRYQANINGRDEEGYTPLHKAIIANNLEMVIFLLRHGADVGAIFKRGLAEFRCIDLARQYGSSDLSMLFIDKNILMLEEGCRQLLIEANNKKIGPIELAFQKSDLELAEYLLQIRERDLVLKKPAPEFPGYEFTTLPQGNPIWQKPTPIKMKGQNGVYTGTLNRIDCKAVKILMKYDSKNIWKKHVVEWLSQSYHLGDLETIAFLYPLAKKADVVFLGFKNGDQRYLIDPFLSEIPIDLEDPSLFYIPGLGRKIPPSLFEYRLDDNAQIKKLKKEIQELVNS